MAAALADMSATLTGFTAQGAGGILSSMKRSELARAGTDAFAALGGSRLDGSGAGSVPFGDVALAAGQRLELVPGFGVLWLTAGAGHFRSIEPVSLRVPPARLASARGSEAPAIVPLERGALLLFVAGAPDVGTRRARGSACAIGELVARAALEAHAWSLDVARSPALLARELPPARAIAAPELSRQQPLATLLHLLASEPSPAVRDCLLEALLLRARPEPHPAPLHAAPRQGAPLHDTVVARALQLLQKDLGRRWSVDELGAAVGLSRAALARRFVAALGEPPLRLQARLRLERAALLLERTDASLAEVAAEVGYESEFAFSRAFRRRYGVAPGAHRQRARALEGARTRIVVEVGALANDALSANDGAPASDPCSNDSHDARASESCAKDARTNAATRNAAPAPQPAERRVIGFLRPHGAEAPPARISDVDETRAAPPGDAAGDLPAGDEIELEVLHVGGRVLPNAGAVAVIQRADVRPQGSALFTRACAGSRAA